MKEVWYFDEFRLFCRLSMDNMKYFKILGLFMVSSILFSCQNKLDKSTIESRLQNLQDLGTVEYTLSKVLSIDDEQWYTVGERKVLMSIKANLKAGVDFSQLEILSFDDKSKSIEVKMPESKIILLDIPPNKVKYELVHVDLLRDEFTNEEMNKIQVLGEKAIREKISDLGILEEAHKNAKGFVESWLKMLGMKKIKIS